MRDCRGYSGKDKFPNMEEYNTANTEFIRCCSGSKIYVLNHVHGYEKKYNYTDTSGDVFCTNDKIKFMQFLEKRI